MSDSGLPGQVQNLPESQNRPGYRRGVAVRLISAPPQIIPEQKPVQVQGEVLAKGPGKRIRISTEHGPVIIEAREGVRRQLSEGQRVELEIPPENYDRQARLRLAQDTRSESPAASSSRAQRQEHDRHAPPPSLRDTENVQRGAVQREDVQRYERPEQYTPPSDRQAALASTDQASAPSPERNSEIRVMHEGQDIRLSRLQEDLVRAIEGPIVEPHSLSNSSLREHQALSRMETSNERYLQALEKSLQTGLMENIARIFGRGETAPAFLQTGSPDAFFEGFILSTAQAGVQLSAMSGFLQNQDSSLLKQSAFFTSINARAPASETVIFNPQDTSARSTAGEEIETRMARIFVANKSISIESRQTINKESDGKGALFDKAQISLESPPKKGQITSLIGQKANFAALSAPQFAAGGMKGTNIVQNNSGQGTGDPVFVPPAGLRAGQVTAFVMGQMPDGRPVLQFTFPGFGAPSRDMGFFTPNAALGNLAAGTQITFSPSSPESAAGLTGQTSSPLPGSIPPALTPGPWESLNDMRQTLFQVSPQNATRTQNLLPSPAQPAQLTATMMLFAAAVRGGDISMWLGERAQNALRQAGKGDVLDSIKSQASSISRASGEQAAQSDWRVTAFPLLWEEDIYKTTLWTRPEPDPDQENASGREGGAIRFVLDMNLERMGNVQIDGLVRPKKLDVVLRTQDTFSPETRKAMRAGYIKALQETSLNGELHFHGAASPVKPEMGRKDQNWSDLV